MWCIQRLMISRNLCIHSVRWNNKCGSLCLKCVFQRLKCTYIRLYIEMTRFQQNMNPQSHKSHHWVSLTVCIYALNVQSVLWIFDCGLFSIPVWAVIFFLSWSLLVSLATWFYKRVDRAHLSSYLMRSHLCAFYMLRPRSEIEILFFEAETQNGPETGRSARGAR